MAQRSVVYQRTVGRNKGWLGTFCVGTVRLLLLASVSTCSVERFAVGEDPGPSQFLPDAGDALSASRGLDAAGGAGGTVALDPCAGVDCRPGMCRVDNGEPRCVCPSGNVRDGLRCLVCLDTGNRLTVVLPTRPVRVSIDVNGLPIAPGASVTFRNVVNLVDVNFGDLLETRRIPLGRYEVRYSGFVGQGFEGPGNRNLLLGEVDIKAAAMGESATLLVSYALNVVKATGTMDLGEDHPDVAPFVNLVFTNGDTRVLARFLGPERRAFEAFLIPGSYDHGLSGSAGEDVVVYGTTTFPFDGQSVVRIAAHRVQVVFDDTGDTDLSGIVFLRGKLGILRLSRVRRGVYTTVAPEGDYDLEYAMPGDGVAGPPLELVGPVLRTYRITGPVDDTVFVKLVRARGRVTVDGKAPIPGVQSVRIRSERLGSVPLRLDAQGMFDERVFPGSYRLEYRCDGAGCRDGQLGPANRESLLGSVDIREGQDHIFDIPVGKVDLSVTENSQTQSGTISLVGDDPSAWFSSVGLVESTGSALAVRIVQNDYAVTYRRTGLGTLVSRVANLSATAFQGVSAFKASWDLAIVRVSGRIDVGLESRFRQFRLENPDSGYVAFDVDSQGNFVIDVPRSSYLLRPGAGSQKGVLGCFTISPP